MAMNVDQSFQSQGCHHVPYLCILFDNFVETEVSTTLNFAICQTFEGQDQQYGSDLPGFRQLEYR